MSKDVEWRQVDDYYWQGPLGWTICRAWSESRMQFELWNSSADGGLRLFGKADKLGGAQEIYRLTASQNESVPRP